MISEGRYGDVCGKGKFIIDVKYQEYATWQGEVTWVEKGKRCRFRSALELLKIIDQTLDSISERKTL